MKGTVYTISGEKKGDVQLPTVFGTKIREDIVLKTYEAQKEYSPYGPSPYAGRRHSASGTISHQRHDWKGHYGKGIARVPRKAMWRRGDQFYWVGAEINSARGGRRVHPPAGMMTLLKINAKEQKMALRSAIAATASPDHVMQRYSRIEKVTFGSPLVLASPVAPRTKSKEFEQFLDKTLGNYSALARKQTEVRSGKGKGRGRKYKRNAGLLVVTGKDEQFGLKGFDVRRVTHLRVADLYPLGRLTLYTEQALKELA
jgi:large subunit ribosomal protein L4e